MSGKGRRCSLGVCFGLALGLGSGDLAGVNSAEALQFNTYVPQRHERYYAGADKAFYAPFNMSAIGGTGGGWVTMIDDTYFLTAAHAPAGGDQVLFMEGTDPAGPRHSFQTSYVAVGTWGDLRLGRLTAPIPSWANIVPIPMWDGLGGGRGQPSPLNSLYVVGRGYYGAGPWVAQAVGKDFGSVSGNLLNLIPGSNTVDLSNPDLPPNPDGANTVGGDSGGPTVVVINGQPKVAGIHYVVNGDSYVPASRSAILSAIATDRAAVSASKAYTHTNTIPTDVPGNFRSNLKFAYLEAEIDTSIRMRPEDAGRNYTRSGGTSDPGVKVPEADGSGEFFSMRSMKREDVTGGTATVTPNNFYWRNLPSTAEFSAGWYFVYVMAGQEPGRGAQQNYQFYMGDDTTVDSVAPSIDTTITTSATPGWFKLGLVNIPDGVNTYRLGTSDDSLAPYFDTLMFVQLSFQVVPEPGAAGVLGLGAVWGMGKRRR